MSDWESKPSEGYATIEAEFEATLRRAFVDRHADFIRLFDRRETYLWESVRYGRQQGWLDDGELVQMDEQSSEARFRLTAKGRKHFKVTKKKKG